MTWAALEAGAAGGAIAAGLVLAALAAGLVAAMPAPLRRRLRRKR